MCLSTLQGINTSLLYTARMAARSVGTITPKSSTNSISLIHTLAVSDGTATLPHPSIVMFVRSIGVRLYGETSAYLALESGYVVFKFRVRHLCVNLRGGDICVSENLANALYRHTVIESQNSE